MTDDGFDPTGMTPDEINTLMRDMVKDRMKQRDAERHANPDVFFDLVNAKIARAESFLLDIYFGRTDGEEPAEYVRRYFNPFDETH